MHSYRSLDKGDSSDAANLHLLIGMMLILTYQTHKTLMLRLLNILYGDILLAVDIYGEQIHVSPKYVANI